MDRLLLLVALGAVLSSCGSTGEGTTSEELARDHMSLARAFESESLWQDAAIEYSIVGDLYPNTSYYETAVRKAATLFSHPDNDLAADSTVFRWLQEYSTLSLAEGEQTLVESHISLLKELRRTGELLAHQMQLSDSLAALTVAQQEEIAAGTKRIRDLEKNLETKLAKTQDELDKLRKIDMEVGREKEKE